MKQSFPYEKVYWQEFEDIVIKVCQDILGVGAKKFSDGRDGGRDSRFSGMAEKFPSASSPWNGKWIIQAKHTEDINSSCSDSDFSGEIKSSIISKEIERLKKLKDDDPFENYLLFTNRKLPADKDHKIATRIRSELGISNVEIIGKELLDTYITTEIATKFDLDKYVLPFRIFEKDIQDVITIFHGKQDNIKIDNLKQIIKFKYLDKQEKNKINNLSETYFKHIQSHSLQHFLKIETFLKDSKNRKYAQYYENTVSDLQSKIIVKRSDFSTFDLIIEFIVDFILKSDIEKLKDYRKLIRVFIHFMYWQCDIGEKE